MNIVAKLGRRIYDRPFLLLFFATLSWAGNWVLGRAIRNDIPPIAFAYWRWTVAFLLVLGFALPHLRRDWPAIRANWAVLTVLSVLGIATFNTMAYIGLRHTDAINGMIYQSSAPLMIALIGFLAFRDRLTTIQALGILISLAGVLTVIARGEPQRLLGLELSLGDAWILGGFACYSAYSVLLRKRPPLHWLSFLTVTFALGIVALTPVYLWDVARGGTFELTVSNAAAIGYVALFASVMAYICFNRGVELIGANRAGPFFHLVPLQGTVLAILLLGEELRLFHVIGFVLIIAGVALATRAVARSPSERHPREGGDPGRQDHASRYGPGFPRE